MVRIPGGLYTIGSPAQHVLANRAAMPQHKVELKPFLIDRSEVTNGQFAEFLNAMGVRPIGTQLGGNSNRKTFRRNTAQRFFNSVAGLRPTP